eukprot:6329336-Pyramimonas_sp.AAC.1
MPNKKSLTWESVWGGLTDLLSDRGIRSRSVWGGYPEVLRALLDVLAHPGGGCPRRFFNLAGGGAHAFEGCSSFLGLATRQAILFRGVPLALLQDVCVRLEGSLECEDEVTE